MKAKPINDSAVMHPVTTPVVALMRPTRFLILFFAFLLTGFALLLAPLIRPMVLNFSGGLVSLSATLIRLGGGSVGTAGVILLNPSSGFAVEMKDGCNGANVLILLWAAMLAFPGSWRWKFKGIIAGTAAIQAVNLVRFISLFYLGQYNKALFDFAHNYLWEALMFLDAMVVFWVWAQPSLNLSVQPPAIHA